MATPELQRSGLAEPAQAHQGPELANRDGFTVIDCAACGYAHVVPLPTVGELAEVYRHDYYATEKPLYLTRYEEDRGWWMDVYADRLDSIEAGLPAAEKTVLDIGCGPGLFLDAAAQRGWRTLGVEPSRQAAGHARSLGHEIRDGFFDEALARTLEPVDAIHLALVLEHVPDPAAILDTAHRLLKPGGTICIVVPNDFNPLQRAAENQGQQPWWVAPPHHLNYFTPASLRDLARRCGFAVNRQTATFPMELFLLMGENYVGDDGLGRACHGKRKAFETAMRHAGQGDRLAALYDGFADLNLGREIVLFATPLDGRS